MNVPIARLVGVGQGRALQAGQTPRPLQK